jgi:hypothetical protein
MNKGKMPGCVVRGEFGNAPIHYRPRQFVPRDELLAAFKDAPCIDYEELREDIDAVADPAPWGWDDWEARSDRHVGRDRPTEY